MNKIENIDRKLYMYALFDNELNKFDMLLSGFNDDDACKYYLNEFNSIKKTLCDNFKDDVLNKKLDVFLDRIHKTSIYRIAEFDFEHGCFINELVQLVVCTDFNFESEDKKK